MVPSVPSVQPVSRDSVLDVATAADAAARDRGAEKVRLITEIAVLSDRQDALKQMIEEKKTRLNVLMNADGDQNVTTPYGAASIVSRRKVRVRDARIAAERFDRAVLAEYFSPTTDFVDALTVRGIPFEDCIEVEEPPVLEVRRPQSAADRAWRDQGIARTKAETAATIARIVSMLAQPNNRPNNP